jgi:hypothetical protein
MVDRAEIADHRRVADEEIEAAREKAGRRLREIEERQARRCRSLCRPRPATIRPTTSDGTPGVQRRAKMMSDGPVPPLSPTTT